MTYDVYGLRLRDSNETRYIGISRRGLKHRLRQHHEAAARSPDKSDFSRWLVANRGSVEAFRIAATDDREAAKGIEKILILACLRFKQPLLNTAHVPSHLLRRAA